MDYKSVLEEQIRELQKVQDSNVKNIYVEGACQIAQTILTLVLEARNI